VLIHGAGGSEKDFAAAGRSLARHLPRVYAFDMLGHGCREACADLGHERLVEDGLKATLEAARLSGASTVVLVGHSLGACIAARIAERIAGDEASGVGVAGLVAAEMVERASRDGLEGMRRALAARPKGFDDLREATAWALRVGMFRSEAGAREALAGMLRPADAGRLAWTVDLAATEDLWSGWLEGHTARFLSLRAPRLLLLSATDNSDPALLTAQMQGRFAVRTLPYAGHFLHVDAPRPFAQCVVEFLARAGVIEAAAAAGCAWDGGPCAE